MTARNKYVVEFNDDKPIDVYADQFALTPNGDAVFHQVRKSALVNDKGVRNMEDDMTPVLMVKASRIKQIQLIAHGATVPAYEDPGAIQLTH